MARTGFFHHVGTFLLFAAFVLLLVTSISSPVINHLSMLKVDLTNGTATHRSSVRFGSFGYCILNAGSNGKDFCTGSHVGYKPAVIMENIENTHFSTASRDSADSLTNAMVLHPIACFLAFVAFLLALGAGIIGSVFSAFVAAIAWIVTLVVMAIDFALFAIVKNNVNKDSSGSHAVYGPAIWTVMAAMIALFFGMVIVFFTCFSARLHRRSTGAKTAESGYAGRTTTRRRFWQRR